MINEDDSGSKRRQGRPVLPLKKKVRKDVKERLYREKKAKARLMEKHSGLMTGSVGPTTGEDIDGIVASIRKQRKTSRGTSGGSKSKAT